MAAKIPIKDVTVIWHLGFQKTGTTIFQSLMRRNMETLSRHCALFPKRKWTAALQLAGRAWWENPGEETEAALKREARAIRDAIREQGHTAGVVSDENVIGLHFYDERGGMVDMAAHVMPVLEAAIRPARSVFVFYTRDWEKWLASAWNQVVKQLRCQQDFDDWRAGIPFEQDWQAHHARLSGVVRGEVVFRDLGQDAAEDKPMGGYILERAGVPPEALEGLNRPIGRNESLPPGALRFMLDLNRSKIHDRGLDIVRKMMLRNLDAFR